MIESKFKHEFNIGERIYHNTPESDEGLVLDVSYSKRYNQSKYMVVWNKNNEDWYLEDELIKNKIY